MGRLYCGIVLDFFSGVGSISLAAYSLKRHYIGIEVNKKYHEAAVERLKNYQVVIEECSEEFEQIKMFI